MDFITNRYQRNFLVRYDFDTAIPYYKKEDFKGLKGNESSFINTRYNDIHYFTYYYEPIKSKKVIIFLPGIGPGHKAYLRAINEFALKGYKVITLDYEGCGSSGGSRLPSVDQPSNDVIELIKHLNLKEEIVLVGHSLGAYTALNVINKLDKVKKAVIISGFLNVKYGMMKFVKFAPFANKIAKYEYALNLEYPEDSNFNYLKSTTDEIFFIHSIDDPTVGFKYLIPKVSKLNNPHLSFYIEEHKRHNPTYKVEAVKYKDKIINKYFKLLKKEKFHSEEERKNYFKDVSIDKLTETDPVVFTKIFEFIG